MIVPARTRKHKKKLDAEIVQHYQDGESLRAIAGRFVKSHEFVRNVLIRLGIPPRPARRRRTIRDAEVARRYLTGESCHAIGKSLSKSHTSIRDVLVRLGIPRRSARRGLGTGN